MGNFFSTKMFPLRLFIYMFVAIAINGFIGITLLCIDIFKKPLLELLKVPQQTAPNQVVVTAPSKTNRELVLWKIAEQEDLVPDENILCVDKWDLIAGLVFDFTNLKLCVYQKVGSNSDSPTELLIFPVTEILSLEVIEDGQTVSHSTTTGGGEIKTSSGSMLGRAVVGGVLLGGVGAIIGGSTARKTTTSEAVTHTNTVENVNEIKLKMLVNNTTKPLISIPFLSSPTVKGSTAYMEACQKIEHCEALIKVLMMRASAKAAT